MEFEKITLEADETTLTASYRAARCDFAELFNALSDFHDGNSLEECCVYLRLFEPEEIRDDGKSAIEKAIDSGAEVPKRRHGRKAPKKDTVAVPADAGAGSALTTSFHWRTVKPDDAKFIGYMFYIEGWPAKIECRKVAGIGGNSSEIVAEMPANELGEQVLGKLDETLCR